jgi:hypothetical protein
MNFLSAEARPMDLFRVDVNFPSTIFNPPRVGALCAVSV